LFDIDNILEVAEFDRRMRGKWLIVRHCLTYYFLKDAENSLAEVRLLKQCA